MKLLYAALLSAAISTASAQKHSLSLIWETDTVLPTPESVLPDLKKGVLYVSLIDGAPWEKDGKGGIAKITPDGKVTDAKWVTGLNAPKGMGMHSGKLYTADLNQLVVVDVKTGKIEKKLTIEGAERLNDVTIDSKGVIYISDSGAGKVFKVEKGQASLFLDNLQGVNGLKAIKDDLYILGGPVLYKTNSSKQLTKIADGFALGGDGLEPVGNGDFIVSCWGGLVYYVKSSGEIELMIDSREEKINTADIGYNVSERIVYIPTFFRNTVAAYKLK